jgi:uncharacterized protein YegL
MKSITLLIIDESGSMAGMEGYVNETYLGIVNQIKTELIATPELEQFLEIWTFEGDNFRQRVPFMQLSSGTIPSTLEYKPGFSTPLFDAMGISLTAMDARIKSVESLKESHVNVSIITDGMENSSTRYSGRDIAKMVDSFKESNWNFAYYGTNHDVFSIAKDLKMDYVKSFVKDEEGFMKNLNVINERSHENRRAYMDKFKK